MARKLRGVVLLALSAPLALAGCGGDDGDGAPNGNDEDDCLLQVTLSGAVTETLAYDSRVSCSGSSTDLYTALSWGGFDESAPINFGVFINGSITEPSTGTLSRVQITSSEAQATWKTPDTCLVDITESTVTDEDPDFGTSYTLDGNGTCSDPAADGAGGEVTVGNFVFRGITLVP
jgi:hypothetical protein